MYTSSDDVIDDFDGKIDEYKKNKNVYLSIADKTEEAIKNAKKLEKYHLELGQALDSDECNPYTAIYKVVEDLIERNK